MNYLQKQAQNKNTTVSKILRINRYNELNKSSSPDIELIRKLKNRINTENPMLRLSITDYEFMCKNNMALTMMAKVLDTDKKKLKKICRQLYIFKEYINSSPETIKNNMKAQRLAIIDLPKDLRKSITDIFTSLLSTKYILRKGIPFDKLEKDSLSSNPNAIDYLLERPRLIHWGNLSENPKAIELLEVKFKEEEELSNEELANIPRNKKIDWRALSANSAAIKLIKAKYKKEKLSPGDSNSLRTFTHLDWRNLSANPCALEILSLPENRYKIDWDQLSHNPNPEAEVLLRAPENIQGKVWDPLPLTREAIDLQGKTAEQNDIGYVNSKIRGWSNLSLDPNAINLLVKRVAYEDKLPKEELAKIIRINKINWYFLTINPAIFI